MSTRTACDCEGETAESGGFWREVALAALTSLATAAGSAIVDEIKARWGTKLDADDSE